MSLITLLDSHLAYGDRPLLDGAQLAVRTGERVGKQVARADLLAVDPDVDALGFESGFQRRDPVGVAAVIAEEGVE